ncbi:DNA polymerase III subunit delta' [Rarobacter faecitabidus]|uniref:DNA polymerase-3 subunit delta n=1 Tax=Rarobacter faecitabidus TaxID=13243 RepID=A0A542ZTG9_RARFA|nr:DNA polymerase III subunit delta' [Rarobacter faecitabidus]TQL63653.1 DNA polymerase-3 subunit delta' [Rarobacter faecitabidus]
MSVQSATGTGVWGELVGQDRAMATLKRAVTDPSAMTHAWLITGPPGSGRSNAALAFAAALQCPRGGCGECQVCTSVLAGTNPDVEVLRTDKVVIAIDEVRELVTTAGRSPVGGRWRVIIVEDADRMIERTTNVLLKAIEEPSPRTVWILCAPSPMDVLVTIRSRCRAVSLQVPDTQAVADLIVRRDGVSPQVALDAARAAWSHVGRARRLANDPAVAHQRISALRAVLTMRGVAGAVRLAGELVQNAKDEAAALSEESEARERGELLTALGAQDLRTLPPAIRSQVRHLEEDQKRRRRRREIDTVDQLLIDIAGLFRDVLVTAIDAQVETLNSSIQDDIEAAAAQLGTTAALAALDSVALARTRIAGNVTPLLAIEALLVSIAEPRR